VTSTSRASRGSIADRERAVEVFPAVHVPPAVGAVVLVARVFEHPPGALAVDVRDGDERRAEPDVRPAVPFEENDVVLGEHAEVVVDGVDVAVQAVCECSDARRGFLARSTCWPKPLHVHLFDSTLFKCPVTHAVYLTLRIPG
jgi:hypothetical protein